VVLIFFIAGLLYLLRFERVDNLGAYRIPPETGLLIPSVSVNQRKAAPDMGGASCSSLFEAETGGWGFLVPRPLLPSQQKNERQLKNCWGQSLNG
jgi:hypothetical protein